MLILSGVVPTYLTTGNVEASAPGEVLWTQTSNPSPRSDGAYGISIDGSGIYTVGWDSVPGNFEWRIEKRSLADGSLIWSQTSNPSTGDDYAFGASVDSSGVYIVGSDYSPGNEEWRIEKRRLTDGSLIWSQTINPSSGRDEAYGVTIDGSGIYIVGFDSNTARGDYEWRSEKRSLADGRLLWSRTSDLTAGNDMASGVAVDGSGVYIVGSDYIPGDYEWRIEKLSLADGSLIWSQRSNPSAGSDGASGVAVDGSGIYIVGGDYSPGNLEWRVEKRSITDGTILWSQTSNPSPDRDSASEVAVDSSGIYIVGFDNSPMPGTSDSMWRIEKRSLADGSLIWSRFNNPSVGDDGAYGAAVDHSGVYIVGHDYSLSDYKWRIEKRDPGRPVSKLVITTYPTSVIAGTWTSVYTVQRQDQYSNPVSSGSTSVSLASTSTGAGKKFAETSGGAPVASITIPDGSSTRDFYYYDDKTGSCSISVSAPGLLGESKTLTVNPRSGCIVATAAYGSELAPEVAYMRHVRDEMVGSNALGKLLVDGWNVFYYSWSPPIAESIASSGALQDTFRILLLPVIATVHLTAFIFAAMEPIDIAFASLVAFLFAASSSIIVYILTPLFIFRSVHRKRSKLYLDRQR